MKNKKNLLDFTLEKLEQEMSLYNQKPFRARQIFTWIYKKRVFDFDKMSDIALSFREVLKENYCIVLPTVEYKKISVDNTVKALVKFSDGQLVESVLMRYNYGDSVCVSSQVGCLMGCKFCASGLLKKVRNLQSGEMVGQFLVIDEILKKEVEKKENAHLTHCVVMGTGEPFDNYDNVLDFVKILNCPYGIDMGARHISISTCGLVEGIKKFKQEKLQVNLAISLHAPNDELRDKLMPINHKYPLEELISAIKEYNDSENGRRVTYEYIMLEENSTLDCAKQLVELIKPTFGYVNLIPYNEVCENSFKRASNNRIFAFRDYLNEMGIKATIRKEFGSDIDAACGQLRARYKK